MTGASGFIGSHVANAALSKGHAVTAAVRNKSTIWRLLQMDIANQMTIRDGYSCGDEAIMGKLLERSGFDAIIHAASSASRPGAWQAGDLAHDTITDVVSVCNAAIRFGVPRVVLFGSAIAYGRAHEIHDEGEQLVPVQPYGLAKSILSQVAQFFAAQGLIVVELRPFNVYGPLDTPPRLVPYCIQSALCGDTAELAGGDQARDFVHVFDVAKAALAAASGTLPSGAYNVATGIATPVSEVANRIFDAAGVERNIELKSSASRQDTHEVLFGSSAKLASFGLAPEIGLAEGLAMTVAAARQQGVPQ